MYGFVKHPTDPNGRGTVTLHLNAAAADTLRAAMAESGGPVGHEDTTVHTTDGDSVLFRLEGDWDRADMDVRNGGLLVTSTEYHIAADLNLREANRLSEQLAAQTAPPLHALEMTAHDKGEGEYFPVDVYFVRADQPATDGPPNSWPWMPPQVFAPATDRPADQ